MARNTNLLWLTLVGRQSHCFDKRAVWSLCGRIQFTSDSSIGRSAHPCEECDSKENERCQTSG